MSQNASSPLAFNERIGLAALGRCPDHPTGPGGAFVSATETEIAIAHVVDPVVLAGIEPATFPV